MTEQGGATPQQHSGQRAGGFKKVEARPHFPTLEQGVVARWKRDRTFQRSVDERAGKPEFIFYDGPPFATGSPHHGTIFISALKDLVGRYKTMRGFQVPRTWGWDCHGLPIETIAEKNLGLKDKSEIESGIGVAAFNAECRRIVSNYDENWRTYIDRIGRWVDMERPYRTLDRSFMESVIWAFAEAHRKGLIYKDYRVAPYCYRCETPLSLSEIRVDDSTRPKQDRALTVKFELLGADLDGVAALAWTTTPWTLPANLGLAVGAEIEYVVVESKVGRVLLAHDAVKRYQRELGEAPTVVATVRGAALVERGVRYRPILPYFQHDDAFRVILGDFVSTQDGTGIVHMAPAFGEDDYWACRRAGIEVRCPVDSAGCYTHEIGDFAGHNVHTANPGVAKLLKDRGVVVRDETIEHNYPHCWRCRNPLIYRALDAWYFKVEALRERLIQANQEISWYPETVKFGRFGNWLENARDWNISRNRYWATPIPVWECGGCGSTKVYGSVADLERDAGVQLTDLHKEFLDPVEVPCGCGAAMKRVPEVLDCWFESGSMPYGQFHYPFENADHFRSHFPADFIVEYTGQIRCWFYYLHVLSTAIFDRPAFRHCMVHGTLLAADGKKMSKSLKNYTDPLLLMDRHGADALRAYLFASPAVGIEDLSFRDEGVEGMVKSILLPFWNALLFFTSYTEVDGVAQAELGLAGVQLAELDRFILSELELLTQAATEALEQYRVHDAMRLFAPFFDTLNNWYIRRSRERVWSEDPRSAEKVAFYATLHDVLGRCALLLAPLCPFIAELVWERLGYADSVHLCSWPEPRPALVDAELSEQNNLVRSLVSAGLAVRAREKLRVRLPLARATVALRGVEMHRLEPYIPVLCGELNVKSVEFLSDAGAIATLSAKVNARVLGPRLGARVQEVIQKVRAGAFEVLPDNGIQVHGGEIVLSPSEVELGFTGKAGLAVEAGAGFVIALDTAVTPALALEGQARDLVREVQDMRKEADLQLADRIRLAITGAAEIVATHSGYLCAETLCVELRERLAAPLLERTVTIEGAQIAVALERAS
jgi:isoleucyl-tRNA synthetase